MWSATYRALTTTFRVAADDGAVAALAANLFAAYARDDSRAPDLDYRLAADGVYRDGRRVSAAEHPFDLVPGLELEVFARILARADAHWLVHAATVVINGRCIVLAGPSGAGKSTAALVALEQLDAGYVSDEHTAIDATGTVSGIPRPLSFDRAPATTLHRTRYPIHRPDGAIVDHMLIHPDLRSVVHDPQRVHAVALIRYEAGAPRSCERVSLGQALSLLWQEGLNTGDGVLRCATTALSRAQCYRVVSATTADILSTLRALAAAK